MHDRDVEDMNLTIQQDNSTNHSLRVDKTGELVLLVRSRKEAPLWFSSILSVTILLFVFGIVVNGAICFVMLRGKATGRTPQTSSFCICRLQNSFYACLSFRLLFIP